jgi:hypothetical protein
MRSLAEALSLSVTAVALVVVIAHGGCSAGGGSNTGDDAAAADGPSTSAGTGGGGGQGTGGAGEGGGCTPTAELCDGKDNDCDGELDEGCACKEGDTVECYTGAPELKNVGACKPGVQTCDLEGKLGPCEGEGAPSDETCDGIDNDCDGGTDEDLGTVTCGLGICQVTVVACEAGQPKPCIPGKPNPKETCDGVDDNCDGNIDEGCACLNDQQQSCYPGSPATKGIGECQDGTQTCVNGAWGACVGAVTPTSEKCNGLDDDCDTKIDNGDPEGGAACNTGKLGVCAAGVEHCTNAKVVCEQTTQPSAESCNGKDDDCDGFVDENNPEGGGACDTGLLGVCKPGVFQCKNGALKCEQATQPSAEKCNGKDDDCDGFVDENNPEGGGACNTGQSGICAAGTLSCQNGSLVCKQNEMAVAETCNGKDDDCDGVVDDGNPGGGAACNTGLQGVCADGTTKCEGGSIKCNQNLQPSAEKCNGKDDDCDGMTDEGNPESGQACSTGQQGVCSAGTTDCQNGSLKCLQSTPASPEEPTKCEDGLDNDCDGTKDAGDGSCACPHGLCTTGAKMFTGCAIGGTTDACVKEICNSDPFCCDNMWDQLCVNEVDTTCQIASCGTCTHSICTMGEKLVAGCDTSGCVSKICAASVDPYCCNTAWDNICVGEVNTVCGIGCL